MIAGALRRGRTAALWLAGPIDRLWLHATGRAHLPPLWLRRHTGPVRAFESAARETAGFLDRLELVRAGDTVLDVGCGPGAMVPELARRLGPAGRYVGFDVHAASIRWAAKRHAGDPRLRFQHADLASAWGPGTGAASAYRFPLDAGQADFVLAKSVFTHLLEAEARHYLAEVRRVLRPGRGAVVTAFLYDESGPRLPEVERAFPFSDGRAGALRWRVRSRPSAAVAYGRDLFEAMVSGAGLRVIWMSAGYFPGNAHPTGQDTLVLGH